MADQDEEMRQFKNCAKNFFSGERERCLETLRRDGKSNRLLSVFWLAFSTNIMAHWLALCPIGGFAPYKLFPREEKKAKIWYPVLYLPRKIRWVYSRSNLFTLIFQAKNTFVGDRRRPRALQRNKWHIWNPQNAKKEALFRGLKRSNLHNNEKLSQLRFVDGRRRRGSPLASKTSRAAGLGSERNKKASPVGSSVTRRLSCWKEPLLHVLQYTQPFKMSSVWLSSYQDEEKQFVCLPDNPLLAITGTAIGRQIPR